VLVPTVLVFALVTLFVTTQPDRYESHVILMSPLKKPLDPAAERDADKVGQDIFRSATERLTSSAMLLKVAEHVDPYPEIQMLKGTEAVVEELRSNINIAINRASGSITIFCSHDSGDRPAEMAAAILNRLTDLFVEEQRDAMAEQYSKSVNFFRDQRNQSKKELETAENLLREFKVKHPGELPTDVATNKADIERLHARIGGFEQQRRSMEFQIESCEREISRLTTDIARANESDSIDIATLLRTAEGNLAKLKLDLEKALVTRAEDHEDVILLKRQIAAQERAISEYKDSDQAPSVKKYVEWLQYSQDGLRKTCEQYRSDLKSLDQTMAETRDTIDKLHEKNSVATVIEGDFIALQRAVEEAQGKYDRMVSNFEIADRKKDMTDFDSFIPIQVQQSAFTPMKPAGPDRLLYPLIGLVIGLGVGIGLAVARAKFDPSCHNTDDVRALLPGAVVVTVPEVQERVTHVGRTLFGVLGGLALTGIFAATVGLMGIRLNWWGDPSMISFLLQLR